MVYAQVTRVTSANYALERWNEDISKRLQLSSGHQLPLDYSVKRVSSKQDKSDIINSIDSGDHHYKFIKLSDSQIYPILKRNVAITFDQTVVFQSHDLQ
jgi:argonaute-like protein implicated in RNA metabolism and viral defense